MSYNVTKTSENLPQFMDFSYFRLKKSLVSDLLSKFTFLNRTQSLNKKSNFSIFNFAILLRLIYLFRDDF